MRLVEEQHSQMSSSMGEHIMFKNLRSSVAVTEGGKEQKMATGHTSPECAGASSCWLARIHYAHWFQ